MVEFEIPSRNQTKIGIRVQILVKPTLGLRVDILIITLKLRIENLTDVGFDWRLDRKLKEKWGILFFPKENYKGTLTRKLLQFGRWKFFLLLWLASSLMACILKLRSACM